MSDLPFPLSGTTLIVGPSNAGKTRLTARALDAWVDAHGPEGVRPSAASAGWSGERSESNGVVVLDFAPELERDGRILGGRLDRFTTIPDAVWVGRLDAHAPRAEGESDAAARELARDNADRASELIDAAPTEPRAVFVNDATIARQHDGDAPHRVVDYCDGAELAVCNAFESDELGADHPVSLVERETLAALRDWATRTVSLG